MYIIHDSFTALKSAFLRSLHKWRQWRNATANTPMHRIPPHLDKKVTIVRTGAIIYSFVKMYMYFEMLLNVIYKLCWFCSFVLHLFRWMIEVVTSVTAVIKSNQTRWYFSWCYINMHWYSGQGRIYVSNVYHTFSITISIVSQKLKIPWQIIFDTDKSACLGEK